MLARGRPRRRMDSGLVRRAGGPARYRRSSFPQSARASAGAAARRLGEIGRLLPLRADLVAGQSHALSPGFDDRGTIVLRNAEPGGKVPRKDTVPVPAFSLA